jgi:hypothetical protein
VLDKHILSLINGLVGPETQVQSSWAQGPSLIISSFFLKKKDELELWAEGTTHFILLLPFANSSKTCINSYLACNLMDGASEKKGDYLA